MTTRSDEPSERLRRLTERLVQRVNYERQPTAAGYDLRLEGVRQLARRLGHPQFQVPIVHVAGTKGKGSVTRMVAGILHRAGFRSGSYTSPHLLRLNERFEWCGAPIHDDRLADLLESIWPAVEACDRDAETHPARRLTFFDICTMVAFLLFARNRADAAVIEVGLGGRLDSTNICDPLLTVITSISFDHTRQLGNTLAEIAAEKAGIIKPLAPVICGPLPADAEGVIDAIATARQAPRWQYGRDFVARDIITHPRGCDFRVVGALDGQAFEVRDLFIPLLGVHQVENASLAVAAAAWLERCEFPGVLDHTRPALAAFQYAGRIQVVRESPTVIVDVAHNVAATGSLLATLEGQVPAWRKAPRRWLILSISRDKDFYGMCRLLVPHFDEVLVTQFRDNPRAKPAAELKATIESLIQERAGCRGKLAERPTRVRAHPTPADAWRCAQDEMGAEDLCCVTGSLFLAAEWTALIESTGWDTINSVSHCRPD